MVVVLDISLRGCFMKNNLLFQCAFLHYLEISKVLIKVISALFIICKFLALFLFYFGHAIMLNNSPPLPPLLFFSKELVPMITNYTSLVLF